MKRIAIFGSGGMGREIACTLQRINHAANKEVWQLVGFYDDGLPQGSSNEMGKVLGGAAQLNAVTEPLAVVLAFGSPQVMQRVRQAITNPPTSSTQQSNYGMPLRSRWARETYLCPIA